MLITINLVPAIVECISNQVSLQEKLKEKGKQWMEFYVLKELILKVVPLNLHTFAQMVIYSN